MNKHIEIISTIEIPAIHAMLNAELLQLVTFLETVTKCSPIGMIAYHLQNTEHYNATFVSCLEDV